ncbi:MAG: DUF1836 domain-containing protein [Cellulosilyticaceae bacterium]
MDELWLKKQVDNLRLQEVVQLQEIPSIDLYMDQLITLFEDKLKHTKRNEEDKLLTKTMINNYTKDKVLMPAVKKKYTKEHIILMIMLYQLKNIISIGDIKELFSVVKNGDTVEGDKLAKLYQSYLNSKDKELAYFNLGVEKRLETLHEELTGVGIEDEELETILLVLTLIEQASYHKRLAEKIIDEKIINRKK